MTAPLWTAAEIAAATGGTVHGDFAATGVSIDTRSLETGDLFVDWIAAKGWALKTVVQPVPTREKPVRMLAIGPR